MFVILVSYEWTHYVHACMGFIWAQYAEFVKNEENVMILLFDTQDIHSYGIKMASSLSQRYYLEYIHHTLIVAWAKYIHFCSLMFKASSVHATSICHVFGGNARWHFNLTQLRCFLWALTMHDARLYPSQEHESSSLAWMGPNQHLLAPQTHNPFLPKWLVSSS